MVADEGGERMANHEPTLSWALTYGSVRLRNRRQKREHIVKEKAGERGNPDK